MPRVDHLSGGSEGRSLGFGPELKLHDANGDRVQQHRPRKQSKSFLAAPKRWLSMVFSMLLCLVILVAVALFCGFLYIILKGRSGTHWIQII